MALVPLVLVGLNVLPSSGLAPDTVVAAPSSPDVTKDSQFSGDTPCPDPPPGVALDEMESPGLSFAAEEIRRLGHSQEGRPYFTGMIVCIPKNSLTVYRVPESREFDFAVERIAAKREVEARLSDTKYSLQVLDATRDEVYARRAKLAARGAHLTHTTARAEGYLEVGVKGDKEAAREILSDLGDRIQLRGPSKTLAGKTKISPPPAPSGNTAPRTTTPKG